MSINIYDLSNDVIKQILSYYYTLNDMINIRCTSKEIYKICQELNWNNKIYILHMGYVENYFRSKPNKILYESKNTVDFLIDKKSPYYLEWLKNYLNHFKIRFENTQHIYKCCDIATYNWFYKNICKLPLSDNNVDYAIKNDAVDFIKYLKTIYDDVFIYNYKVFECPNAINMFKFILDNMKNTNIVKLNTAYSKGQLDIWKIQENERAEIFLEKCCHGDLDLFHNHLNDKINNFTNFCANNYDGHKYYNGPKYYLFWYDFFYKKYNSKKEQNIDDINNVDILDNPKNYLYFTNCEQIEEFHKRNIKIKIDESRLQNKISSLLISDDDNFLINLNILIKCKNIFYYENKQEFTILDTHIINFYSKEWYDKSIKYIEEFNNAYAELNFKLIQRCNFNENQKIEKNKCLTSSNIMWIIGGLIVSYGIYKMIKSND
jgi:hypothetical protein